MVINRIAITGSHGVGKTTLAKLVSGKLGYSMLPDVASDAIIHGLPVNERTTLEATFWMFGQQAERELAHERWVTDKCFVDLLVYAHYFHKDDDLHRILVGAALPFVERYDTVVYLPSGEFPIEDDGFRSTDREFQRAIDSGVRGMLEHFGVRYIAASGTPKQRLKVVQSIIEQGRP